MAIQLASGQWPSNQAFHFQSLSSELSNHPNHHILDHCHSVCILLTFVLTLCCTRFIRLHFNWWITWVTWIIVTCSPSFSGRKWSLPSVLWLMPTNPSGPLTRFMSEHTGPSMALSPASTTTRHQGTLHPSLVYLPTRRDQPFLSLLAEGQRPGYSLKLYQNLKNGEKEVECRGRAFNCWIGKPPPWAFSCHGPFCITEQPASFWQSNLLSILTSWNSGPFHASELGSEGPWEVEMSSFFSDSNLKPAF